MSEEEEWRREVVVVGDFDADVDRWRDDREEAAMKQQVEEEKEAAEVARILIVKSMAVIMAW